MKNNIFYNFFLIFLFFNLNLFSQELEINSSKVQHDDINKTTIFNGNVNTLDKKGNKLFSEYAKYNKLKKLLETQGATKIITSAGYVVLGENIFLDNKNKTIYSNNKTQIKDRDGNLIFVEMFNYSILTNIFFSKGNIKIVDVNNNNYNFSEVYIDENKKKIIGSDAKIFLEQNIDKSNINNEPRLFANTMSLSEKTNILEKGIFTYCKIRDKGKCPPWTLQSKKIRHDLAKKTIYYDNVVLKIYDFPIFYAPKFSHPDPTVKRRSGLLAPSLVNSTTLGSGIIMPYFWNLGSDKDLTFTPKLLLNENPLFLAEYRQDFKNSFLIVDAGYTQGYKKKTNKKSSGGRAHFFSNLYIDLVDEEEKNSNIEINLEHVSNDTYLKVYDVNSSLVDKNKSILENTVDFTYQNKDFYFGLTPSAYEDTTKFGNLRHEYLLPLTIEKNIFSNGKYGVVDLKTDLKVRNYEINKKTEFFVNDFNWKSSKWINKSGLVNYFEGIVKTVTYDANNTTKYKNSKTNNELKTALGYFAKLGLYKNDTINKNFHSLSPKLLLRYAPGHMRNIENGRRLNYGNLFNLNKVGELDVVEPGLSTSLGFEYKKNKLNKNNLLSKEIFSFGLGQVISEKENLDIPSTTTLDQRFSDIVGQSKYKINNKMNLNYNFSIDQGYKEFNYNEVSADYTFNKAKFNLGYLQEKNYLQNQEFLKAGVNFKLNSFGELNFSTKRNLLTSSAEFYDLNYNYINDCLKAGIAYRREFYTDRDVESKNSLMFTISIIPFAKINTPTSIR
tara:strand:- start:686 stop:3028 length:2343 start_codon:yes stop_codon:yes gene_type:complete